MLRRNGVSLWAKVAATGHFCDIVQTRCRRKHLNKIKGNNSERKNPDTCCMSGLQVLLNYLLKKQVRS